MGSEIDQKVEQELANLKKGKKDYRWIIGICCTAVFLLISFFWGRMELWGTGKAELAVWKNNLELDVKILKCNDTIQAKESKETQLLIKEFIKEVRDDRTKDILIDNLQNQKIDKLADKMKMRQELDDMQRNLDKLQRQIEDQSYKIYDKRDMLIPSDFDSAFGQKQVIRMPCNSATN